MVTTPQTERLTAESFHLHSPCQPLSFVRSETVSWLRQMHKFPGAYNASCISTEAACINFSLLYVKYVKGLLPVLHSRLVFRRLLSIHPSISSSSHPCTALFSLHRLWQWDSRKVWPRGVKQTWQFVCSCRKSRTSVASGSFSQWCSWSCQVWIVLEMFSVSLLCLQSMWVVDPVE